MRTAAFFDLDDTLIKGNSGMRVTFNYFLRGRIGIFKSAHIVLRFLYYYIGKADPYGFFLYIYDFLRGRRYEDEKKLCNRFFEKRLKKRIYSGAIGLVDEHKKKGHMVVIVTNSLGMMIEKVRDYIDVDDLVSTKIEVKKGIITGKTEIINFGRNKVANIKKLAKNFNIDLKRSYAYSDNNSDIHMLSVVGNPTAVNPKMKMKRHALKNNWKIINFKTTIG